LTFGGAGFRLSAKLISPYHKYTDAFRGVGPFFHPQFSLEVADEGEVSQSNDLSVFSDGRQRVRAGD
jgi:hypothetical protein